MNYYDDANARQYPRNRFATIRLLTQQAEAILDENRRYSPSHHDYDYSDGHEEWHRPRRQPKPSSFIGIFPLLSKLLFFGFVGVTLLLVSLGEFGIIYTMAMPRLYSNDALHFDYTNSGVANQVLGQVSSFPPTQQTNSSDASCPRNNRQTNATMPHLSSLNPLQNYEIGQTYQVMMRTAPVAVVDLFAKHDSWEHYHPDSIPQPLTETHILKPGAPHFIEVVLDLPESKTNLESIGIFSVVVDLQSIDSNTTTTKLLASSTRTARMPHESVWITMLRKAILILPHLVGAIPERRRIVIPAYRFFIESQDFPLKYVKVRLLVSPHKAKEGQVIEVTDASLRIGEELTGMRLVLKEWFFVCATAGTAVLFALQALILFLIQVCCRKRQDDDDNDESIMFDDNASQNLGLNGLEEEDDDRGSSNHNEVNSEQRAPPSFDDEEGEWEPMPQENNPTTDAAGEEAESGHWIPEN